MKILFVYHGGEYPPAERIEKQAKSLTAAGHEIYLCCNNYGDFALDDEQVGDVRVLRVRPTFASMKLNKLLKFPLFFNPLWLFHVYLVAWRHKIEAIQVIDLPLSITGWLVARMRGIPVIIDMWENYPAALKDWGQADWKTLVFKNYKLAHAVERFILRRLNHVITVVEERRDDLVAGGLDASKISIVSNTVDIDFLTASGCDNPNVLDEFPDSYKAIFIGGISNHRGLDTVIRAATTFRETLPNAKIFIGGGGNYLATLKTLVRELHVEEQIHFLGWVPFGELASYLQKSDLCIIPHINSESINTTIPNKLFQCMGLETPVLVSDVRPLKRIVEECDCGYVFKAEDPDDFTRALCEAAQDSNAGEKGKNGKNAVVRKYNWEESAKVLINLYANLAGPASMGR